MSARLARIAGAEEDGTPRRALADHLRISPALTLGTAKQHSFLSWSTAASKESILHLTAAPPRPTQDAGDRQAARLRAAADPGGLLALLSLSVSLSLLLFLDCFSARASCCSLGPLGRRRRPGSSGRRNWSGAAWATLKALIRRDRCDGIYKHGSRTYALGRYRSWRSKCGGRNSFPDHELHWVVAMFSRSSKQDQETAQAVERSTWFNSDGSVRKGPPCHRGCANAATCNGGTGCSVYRDACKTFGEGSEEFCRHMLERGPFLQQSKFSPLSELLRQFPDGVPADYPLPEYWRAGSGRTPALSPIAWGVPGVQEAGSASA